MLPLTGTRLKEALEANERWERTAAELRAELARRDAELERVNAELAVLQRLVFGRSSERPRQGGSGRDEDGGPDAGRDRAGGGGPRGPGARRDYSHLPRVEVIWDLPGGGYCCPECGAPSTVLGDHFIANRSRRLSACPHTRLPNAYAKPGSSSYGDRYLERSGGS